MHFISHLRAITRQSCLGVVSAWMQKKAKEETVLPPDFGFWHWQNDEAIWGDDESSSFFFSRVWTLYPVTEEEGCQELGRISALISHASKVMLKILHARLQQYVNRELPDVQAGFRKGRGSRDQIANIRWIIEKAREFQKNIYFCFIDYAKAFDCVD